MDPFQKRPPRLRLKPLQVPGHPRPIEVGTRLSLGRAADNDVTFGGEAFPSVSTHHALLETAADGEVWVQDAGSRNGTFVNGERTERARLAPGDVVQLGPVGPRFLVVSVEPLVETVFVDPKKVRAGGLSEHKVDELVARRARRQLLALGVVGVAAIVALVWWGRDLARRGSNRSRELERTLTERDTAHAAELAEARGVIEELQRLDRTRQTELEDVRRERTARVEELLAAITRYEGEATRLQERLARLETTGASQGEIEQLREAVVATREDLGRARTEFAKFDPVNLEQARLTEVSDVREAVVLLEVELCLEHAETGARLHLDVRGQPNFEDEGVPWEMESTGSGFCIDPAGWILTNAHVVNPQQGDIDYLSMLSGPLEPRVEIQAVFSGTSRRHPARVVQIAEDADLALVHMQPFDYMPAIEDFDPAVESPPPGSDVYLFGFPLGNFALQEGETVIASTFRGILSRRVGGHLQVDAGVHPGNSGGPITDAHGRVVGVVVSVQSLPDRSAVYTIGYGIPIAETAELWPPPPELGAGDVGGQPPVAPDPPVAPIPTDGSEGSD